MRTTWCSIRLENREPDTFAWEGDDLQGDVIVHDVIRHELLNMRAAFQGPQAMAVSERFSVGMQLAQNREYLTRQGYGLVEVGKPIVVPVLRNQRWLYTEDLPFVLRRRQQASYAVRAVNSAEVELVVDEPAYTKNFQVEPAV